MGETYRLLIAEDDPNTLMGLKELLEDEGWLVTAAHDGKEAEELFHSQRPDLVLLDLMMPKRSGYDVLRTVRTTDSSIPVLLLSAKSEELDKVLGLDLGADDFIAKPFSALELTARIRSALRRAYPDRGTTPENFLFGAWEIKGKELRAYCGEVIKDITPRELKILILFSSRHNQAVSRQDFFKFAWDLSESPLSRTLDQHIAQLRKKLEVFSDKPSPIETVQGVGYRYSTKATT